MKFRVPALVSVAVMILLGFGCNRLGSGVAQQSALTTDPYLRPPARTETRISAADSIEAKGLVGGVQSAPDKKVIHTAELALAVENVDDASNKIRALVLQQHGEIDQVRVWSLSEHTREGELHIRVPSEGLEPALKQIKAVALRVTNEQLSATDVTRQYADNAARMHGLQAEELQYLLILKQAKSVQDVLEVTEKLTEVRTQIEQLQAEINVMSHDIAMSAVTISLTQNSPEGNTLSSWHPMVSARRATRNMIEGLGDWVDCVVGFAIFLPVIGLWALSVGVILWLVWKLLRALWRRRRAV